MQRPYTNSVHIAGFVIDAFKMPNDTVIQLTIQVGDNGEPVVKVEYNDLHEKFSAKVSNYTDIASGYDWVEIAGHLEGDKIVATMMCILGEDED